jgi:hypothetical protein
MKKADIKPGVVYAYQRRDYDKPEPVVFLNAPAAGDLYATSSYHSPPGTPAFRAARDGSRPHRGSGYSSPDVGYPAVMLGGNAPKDAKPEDLLKSTLAGFQSAAAITAGNGTVFTLVTSLAQIAGTYAEAKAEYDQRQQFRRDEADRKERVRAASRIRADAAVAALGQAGISASPDTFLGTAYNLYITLDEAEKFIALLAAKDAQEGSGA